MAAFFITWVMHLLIVILRLMCNYVRRIGLFLITGYCSNTTSCTEKHCELKSNKVCHCYRGKLLSFSFFFPSVHPNFSWHAASVNKVHCCAFESHRQHVKNKRQMCFKQQEDIFLFSSVLHWVLWFGKRTKLYCILSSEMRKKCNKRFPH